MSLNTFISDNIATWRMRASGTFTSVTTALRGDTSLRWRVTPLVGFSRMIWRELPSDDYFAVDGDRGERVLVVLLLLLLLLFCG